MDFTLLAILVSVAALSGIVAKFLKQPLLIGYLFAGVALTASGFLTDVHSVEALAQVGVTLLLFLLGLEMNIKELSSVGRVAVVTGLGQILFTSGIGYLLATVLGIETLPAIYIAVGLTFSSTIIMVKLLSEKKDIGSLYGRIAIGFLLVQDFVAIMILIFLGGLGEGSVGAIEYVFTAIKAVGLFGFIWFLSKYVLPYIFEKVLASSSELLFIGSIAWALGLAAFVGGPLGFTLEIGGFLAGIALSNLPEHLQIASKAKSLRDFFLVIFFLVLGTQLVVGSEIFSLLPSAIILSIFVLVGNPIIVLIILGFSGYKKRTSFMAGLTVAQISEFSFILMNMGENVGHVNDSHVALIVVVGVITMTTSTYLILGAEKVFTFIEKYLSIFEKKNTREAAFTKETDLRNHTVLVGSDRTGGALAEYLLKKQFEFIVVDFNPHLFSRLTANKIPTIFGDINDPEVAIAAHVADAKTIISTINNLHANLTLLYNLKGYGGEQKTTIFTAKSVSDALSLYEAGATYVIVPEVVAGDHLRHLLNTYKTAHSKYSLLGKRHFNNLLYK